MASGEKVSPSRMRVCVVGAGAAGLCAARHLAADTESFEPAVFEQTNTVGGTWVYNEKTGVDEFGYPIHSSMYYNLRTNLPGKIMNFPDFSRLGEMEHGYVTHQQVLQYLRNYADHFQLHRLIQLNVRVENIKPKVSSDLAESSKWNVRIKNLKTQNIEEREFDAVLICNGHFFEPNIPSIPGIETFPGTFLHSHSYRKPEVYSGKTVIILGASSSGTDIAIELHSHAYKVYLSHHNARITSVLPSNIIQVDAIERISVNQFFLKDGTSVSADTFIFCTGYKYKFPFLDESCGIQVDDNYVSPLYKHLINIAHPTMCLVGIPFVVIPFPMFHMQVQFFLNLLKERFQLPPKADMLEDAKLKIPLKRHAHKLANNQWDYNNNLADMGGFKRLPKFYRIGYMASHSQRLTNLLNYKKSEFILSEDGESVQIINH
ncbi:flavin-containing monooxygenase FMO GS-OX-like 4 [Cephus cinctus]|uniref:Flavin-containing monooxygenase n=1 Tax=Cephus cinctus TaxID=211228 RepID=A0AAJ7BYR5_CEPCN|nr:flavin-containing monooxygenase FMO GS-OX-like 4 [Cephus cinctus]XP_015597694.1 flavin-containing monooxygenase FMO GS-OX-like 4 [Cephus cinctus]